MALVAAVVCLALSWVIWLAGGLLALVNSGSWREVPVIQAPMLLVRLIAHPSAPVEAWPPLVRSSLPGSAATDAWLGMLALLGVSVACWLAWRRCDVRGHLGAAGLERSARGEAQRSAGTHRSRLVGGLGPVSALKSPAKSRGWAQPRDLRTLHVPKVTGDRIVLGTLARRLLAAESRHSVMVVGPTQSGKTSGLAIPAILEWSGPLLATSVKADLLLATSEWRRSLGAVQYYDPTGSVGLVTDKSLASGWSPLAKACTWSGARRIAAALCSVARAGEGGMDDAGFWYASAEKLLAPLLFAAATAGVSMADVVRWLDDEETTEVLLALELAGVPEALRAARASFGREERQRASVYATAETIVAGFADPGVAASAESCEIDPAALVGSGAGSLFCCAPAREQERLAPVFTAIVREVIDAAFARAAATGRPLDPPLLVVLDEAASVAPLADLDRVLATAAGHGVQLVTVWQDLAQVEARYGSRWATVVNNHRAKIVCSGIADPLTLQHVGALLGDEERAEHSWTVGDDGRRSRTEAVTVRALAPPGWLRQLPPGEAVLVYGSLPPARIALRPFFSDRELASRATGISPRGRGVSFGPRRSARRQR